KEYNYIISDEIIHHTEKNLNEYKQYPAILIFYKLLMLSLYEREEDFAELLTVKKQFEDSLDKNTLYNIYLSLQIYCSIMYFKGDYKYRLIRFRLDKEFLELELYNIRQYFSLYFFLNCSLNAIQLKEIKWAENF